MRYTVIIASTTALLTGASASAGGPSARASDPHISDFRLWGTPNCENNAENYGVWTVTKSGTKKCTNLHEYVNDPEIVFKGVNLTDITAGYNLYLYTDKHCKDEKTKVRVSTCAGTNCQWKSFVVK